MKIAFVLPYLAERFGGSVAVVNAIGPRIGGMGHNVSYWTTAENKDRHELASMEYAHIYDVGWPRSWRWSRGFVHGLSAGAASVDVIHINEFWPHPIYAASRIALANDIPYILSPSGSLEPWCLRSTPLKWLKKKVYLNLIGKSIMQGAACLCACSAKEAEHFRQAGHAGPITIVPNGVDTRIFTPGDPTEAQSYWPQLKDRPVVLFMSRLSPEKGLDILIPVWAQLMHSAACKNAILVIAGPDDRGYGKVVKAMIEKYDIGSHTCVTGMVQGQKKLVILRRADVFILPSYSENFGIVVAEALACGTPVITTTRTPWEQLEKVNAGRWISPTKSKLIQALRELLGMSESQRKAMGQMGRSLVEKNYTWDIAAGKMIAVYRSILEGRSIPLYPDPVEV